MQAGDRERSAGTDGGTVHPRSRNAALARAQGGMFFAAGVCGFAVLAFPHPEALRELASIPIALVSMLAGIGLYAGAARIPRIVLRLTPALGTLLATGAVIVSESATSAYALFYLWIAFYCVYFMDRREALAHLAFLVANFAVVVAFVGVPARPQPDADVSYLVLATATVVSAGILIFTLRARLEGMSGALSGATRTDPLTGLPNRSAFREMLATEIERARGDRRPVSILTGDVDRLQVLNDALGHDGADRVLISIAELLVEATRGRGEVARIGPGGFGILLPAVEQQGAYMTAEELLTQTRRTLRAAGPSPVTISFGVATFPQRAADAEGLLGAADRSLFAAKVLGRDRAVVSSEEIEKLLRGSPRRRTGESLTQLKTLLSLAEALDQRDERTTQHAETVGWYSEELARELGLPEPRVARVRLAGMLHDIGKVGVPDSILFKAGALDKEEWVQMKRHPEVAARLLASSDLADIREWILACHERPDGAGYPRGLAGGEIPIESRILCVADAYEAMVADRSWRHALSAEQAREELRRGAGSNFDAEVVDAMLAILDRHDNADESMQ